MHALVLGLLILAALSQRSGAAASSSSSAPPRPKPRPAGPPRPLRRTAPKPKPPPVTVVHPADAGTDPAAQAAVDAAVSQAIRDAGAKPPPPSSPASSPSSASIVSPPPSRLQQLPTLLAPITVTADPDMHARKEAAAKALLAFLIKTGRFGSKADRPNEVRAAQAELGVTVDGIVGPATRNAAKAVGVALPPRK